MTKDMSLSENISGVIIVDKGEGVTSQTVVNRVKRLFGVKKAGHTGTLDPLATGVLPVLVGRGVKASEFMLTEDKHYTATLLLGITTDTEDITGEVLSRTEAIPSECEVMSAAEQFVGNIMQIPPMYSAIKVSGRKLYELAREGKEIEREPREVTVHKLALQKLSDREYSLDVECSKGTYIRTLCADIGKRLGCGAVMKALRRTEASHYSLSEAHTIEELEAMSQQERRMAVYPVEHIFRDLRAVRLSDFFSRLARSGLEIYLSKIGEAIDIGARVALYDKKGFFAVGEVRVYPSGTAIKPIRQFDI